MRLAIILVTTALLINSTAVFAADKYGWIEDNSNWYYYDSDGAVYTGWLKLNNQWYYLEPGSGIMQTGWKKISGKWYLLAASPSGRMLTSWQQVDGKWYYLEPGSGIMRTGWIKLNSQWYYLEPGSGILQTGWKKINGNWYLLADAPSGRMLTGWQQVDGKWYYLEPGSGIMRTGWIKLNNQWYYLEPGSGIMKTGWQQISGKWYLLADAPSGRMLSGWQQVAGKWYYLEPGSGILQNGWLKWQSEWYYLEPGTGIMQTGWRQIGGKGYYLDERGIYIPSKTPLSSEAVNYSSVYEPLTSWPMAATIAWRTDESVYSVSNEERRPATGFVWLDQSLNVYDRNGILIDEDLADYVNQTAGHIIPAFYIQDAETAAALKSWITDSCFRDCYVVSTPEHANLVKEVADLLHVRGMLDYSQMSQLTRQDMTDMMTAVNGAHGKVLLISEEAASYENVRFLQSLTCTVWAVSSTDSKTLLTLYTNGVNGVLVDDYEAAIQAEEFFRDDEPSLLRVPFIVGHRGDPSSYVENTLDSAIGAFEAGADSIEQDIQLSSDGEIFVLHDDNLNRMAFPGNDQPAHNMTMNELQAIPFNWDKLINNNAVPAVFSRFGTLYGQTEEKNYVVPSFREYLEEFQEKDIVLDTEIKSDDTTIVPILKGMIDEYDVWDRFYTISFYIPILECLYKEYPEIPTGALGTAQDGVSSQIAFFGDLDRIEREEGLEASVARLYDTIDRWNASYFPNKTSFGYSTTCAARHRGLTAYTWTYSMYNEMDSREFADDFLRGVHGLTTNYPWVTSDYIEGIISEDVIVSSYEDIPKPTGRTKTGEEFILDDAELIELEVYSATQTLYMWRYKTELTVKDQNYGSYYLYSNPFIAELE